MDYGGCDRRKTKNDKRAKRRTRVYKKGGQFRSQDIVEGEIKEKRDKMGKLIKEKNKK